MMFQSIITFTNNENTYLTVNSESVEYAHDMVLSSICILLSLLEFGDNKFDDDVIDHIKNRVEKFRNK